MISDKFVNNVMLLLFSDELNSNMDKNYRHITNKMPCQVIFEELNAEILLSEKVTNNKKQLIIAKSILNEYTILELLTNRIQGKSIFDYIVEKKKFYEEYGGDRIYIRSNNMFRQSLNMFISKLLMDNYAYTGAEIVKKTGKNIDTASRYRKHFDEFACESMREFYDELTNKMKKDFAEILKLQDNKAYITDPDDKKYYIEYDLSEPIQSPMRAKRVKKEEILDKVSKLFK